MFSFFRRPQALPAPRARRGGYLSTHREAQDDDSFISGTQGAIAKLKRIQPAFQSEGAMDDSSNGFPAWKEWDSGGNTISEELVNWYSTQGFIGHQLAGIVAQHWLIEKACAMPGDDAIRNGYSVVTEDGEDIPPEAGKIIKRIDKRFKINAQMREFVRKGRIFGIRIALFKVESTDPEYYEKPFNLDGITPGSYKGIVQVDPYWTAPMLDLNAASQPDSLHFYEPTWWIINGRKYHRTHLVIYRHCEPVDVLKPAYLYGGIPLPQQIMERVYAAERVANEAPMLAQTKRTTVWLTDLEKAASNIGLAMSRLSDWVSRRDNYGMKMGDKDSDEFQQFDTSLADFDALIMTQYQLVAAQANVPATKLIGTTPKGFNSTGDYEEASYHELLESIQTHALEPLLTRHHEIALRAFVVPAVPEASSLELGVLWQPLDTPTAKELAETNLIKAQTGAALIASGALASEDERERVATDKTSGYHALGLNEALPQLPDDDADAEGITQ